MNVEIEEAVLVSESVAGETRWGFHQFPALNRMPDGRILLMYADAEDASETHGDPAPAYISADEGKSWTPMSDDLQPVRPHYSISQLFEGAFLIVPSIHYLDIEKAGISLPEPAATGNTYGTVYSYRCSDLPLAAQDYFRQLQAVRWCPRKEIWEETSVDFDTNGLLAFRREGSCVLPRTFFERPLLQYKNELLYADYRGRFAREDGSVAGKGFTSLMVSTDNGRSFQRRSTVAMDPEDKDLMGEPQLTATADGRLACVVRRSDQDQKPMGICWSEDSGHTWTPVKDLFEFGVWPCVQLLGNGTLVLSYGRPGVHLAFDFEGNGEQWTHQETLIEGDHKERMRHSCGYTSLLSIDDDSLLMAYSDFAQINKNGESCKSIFVRRIRITGNQVSSI